MGRFVAATENPKKCTTTGGGNSNIFGFFTPNFGDFFSNLTSIFFRRVGSTTNQTKNLSRLLSLLNSFFVEL